MPNPLAAGLVVQAVVAVGFIAGDRLDVLPFDAATYAFPALLTIAVVTAALNKFGKVVFTGGEALSWFAVFGVLVVTAVVLYWIVRAAV